MCLRSSKIIILAVASLMLWSCLGYRSAANDEEAVYDNNLNYKKGKFDVIYDETRRGFFAVTKSDTLFQIYTFDNGPDYVSDGLFRIISNGKIGYANEQGRIIIEPTYQCAEPFENGKARVSLNCTETIEFEMKKWESDTWFYIDKLGGIVSE